MVLFAQLGEFGLGTLLLGETRRIQGARMASLCFGSVYCLLASSLSLLGRFFSESSFAGPLFVGGCAITAIAMCWITADVPNLGLRDRQAAADKQRAKSVSRN
ncbi:hypothetical protein NKI82_34210 [Mesorhizobium sp. M0482]|uniref:hypothetical protein n=1 Tax=Mesorhizobium sp. M0482 TaxID=2956948 RepID=UPI00333C2D46